jgi:HEPN domain-containing protein
MNKTVDEWVGKAKNDLMTAEREIIIKENPNYDAVCFHSQQAAEKMMKAVLIHAGYTPSKIHDLMILAKEIKKSGINESIPHYDLIFLSRAAVMYRYPGEIADLSDAENALRIAQIIVKAMSRYL